MPLNVLGEELECCCTSPMTGFYRDGFCRTGEHVPGLKPGDKWCLCALRWKEALMAGVAPPVFLACTHVKALDYVSLQQLKENAITGEFPNK